MCKVSATCSTVHILVRVLVNFSNFIMFYLYNNVNFYIFSTQFKATDSVGNCYCVKLLFLEN